MSERVRRTTLVLGLVLVVALAGVARVRLVLGSSPYVLHEDELIATRRAARMLETGDFDPRFYRYPGLTIYLTAGAFAVAHVVQGEAPSADAGALEPTYGRPEIALSARFLVVALSLATLVLVGALASRAFGEPTLLVLAPLVLALSPRFLMMSWTYVNVDMVGAFVCTLALWHLFRTRSSESLVHRALVPGLLCGAAVGTKYFLGLVGLPAAVLLAGDRARLAKRAAVVVAATVAGFLMTTPYSIVDPSTFAEDVRFEVTHYRSAEGGPGAEPGLEQLRYYLGRTVTELGLVPCLVGLVGLVVGLGRRPRETVLVALFPLALLAFLCTQRVHYIRNFLAAFALFPVPIAYGWIALWRGLAGAAAAVRRGRSSRRAGGALATLVVAAAAAFGVPWERARAAYTAPPDSRNRAVRRIAEHAPPGARVFVASEVMLDATALAGRFDVTVGPLVSFVRLGMRGAYGALDPPPVFVVPRIAEGSSLEEHYGAEVRRELERLDEIWSGGANPVPRRPRRLLHLGDPAIEVRTLPGDGRR